jgi:hypothetical protein
MSKPECKTCGRSIPDGLLDCMDCTLDRSRAALFAYQFAPLRRVVDSGGDLVVRHVGVTRHIQMFGCEFTYCNTHIPDKARKGRVAWTAAEVKTLCADCQRELDRALRAALA